MGEMVCERCKKSVPTEMIRYMPRGLDSRIAVCPVCRDVLESQAMRGPFSVQKQQPQPIVVPPPRQTSFPKSSSAAKKENRDAERKQYFCARCRYKFKFGPMSTGALKCPYCGQSDKLAEHGFVTSELSKPTTE